MARAPDLKSYVKQGAEIAETEIELKGKPGKENVVIWRRFTREDDKSEWRVDGGSFHESQYDEEQVKCQPRRRLRI